MYWVLYRDECAIFTYVDETILMLEPRMIRLLSSAVLIGMIGCGVTKPSPWKRMRRMSLKSDADGDGYLSDEDCDDSGDDKSWGA